MLKKLSKKVMMLAALCLLLAGFGGILALYGELSRVSEMDVLHSFYQALEQTALNLNDRMGFAEETMRSVLYDARMQESISRGPKEETLKNQIEEIEDLREVVTVAQKGKGIAQIRVYLNDVKWITREGINFFSLTQARDTPEYELTFSTGGLFVWMGEHEVKTTYFHDDCITLGCLYRSYFSRENQGWAFVLIDLKPDYFSGILDSLNLPDESAHVAVTDSRGDIMFGHGNADILAMLSKQDAALGFHTAQDGADLAYVSQELASGGWRVTAYMPRASLLDSRQNLRMTLIVLLFGLTLLVVALIGCLLYALYARNVRQYLYAINESLKTSEGRERPLPANRALFDLDRNIGELLETNKRLTAENYRAQLREREVTLQALQAQINPHFLYNTLDSINWMAVREGAAGASDAITTLADYFRLSLSRGRSTVSLFEDIQIAEKYLSLYKSRYDREYEVTWQTTEEALHCAIPKLTLQPLIENALQHGIFKRPEKTGGLIRVSAAVADGMMTLTVLDNGPGLLSGGEPQKGYGLSNIRERLELYFGGKYTMTIENALAGGAQVTIRVRAEGLC